MALKSEIRSKIAGVSYKNPNGESRQELIRLYCKPGIPLTLIPEPGNSFSDTAVGIWVSTPSGAKQVGYVRDTDLDNQLFDYIQKGGKLTCSISEVTGGGENTLGVNILIRIIDGGAQAPEKQSKSIDPIVDVATRTWNSGRSGKITVAAVASFILLLCCCCLFYSALQRRKPSQTIAATAVVVTPAPAIQNTESVDLPTISPTDIPSSTVAPDTADDVYYQEFLRRFSDYQDAFLSMNDHQQKMQADPSLMLDENWRLEMGFSLGILDVAATKLESIPNVTPKYQQLDLMMKDVGSQTHALVENYASGLDNTDAALIEAAIVNLQNITTLFASATEEINRLKSQ